MRTYLHDLGVSQIGMQVKDGSGLSTRNYVTANAIVQFLNGVKSRSYFEPFMQSLCVAGEDGTLKNFGKGLSIERRVFAKTGHSSTTQSLAGYIELNGRYVPFAIIVNNCLMPKSKVRKAIAELLTHL